MSFKEDPTKEAAEFIQTLDELGGYTAQTAIKHAAFVYLTPWMVLKLFIAMLAYRLKLPPYHKK